MAVEDMGLAGVRYDPVVGTIQFLLVGNDTTMPPPPQIADRPDLWQVNPTYIVTAPLLLQKDAVTAPVGVYTDPRDLKAYRVDWTGTAWSTPVRV